MRQSLTRFGFQTANDPACILPVHYPAGNALTRQLTNARNGLVARPDADNLPARPLTQANPKHP
ncbi:MAG: hypothetical protein AVDCRST_MAG56-4682 [uncultured Cytophagales bacterium]|uniref:Uncharacterized protein n=1 Tax=uncultured Cytophagales bacterium TaxID=158755 RepID=A0A6J4JYZ1_9SPHI|nr:MAG: hypothetical protein AVDCRST_MAG56-4682 [uncultured Cytophagales bacterium]